MTTFAVMLLATSGAILVYAYLGYPALLQVIGFTKPPRPEPAEPAEWPLVTLTIPVYNEAGTIRDKLEQVLRLDYPRDKLQILVISDCSNDATDTIVAEFATRGVELLRLNRRGGKTAAENAAVPHLRGTIVINNDASVQVPPHALKHLVRAFQDPTVGVASGCDVSVSGGKGDEESNQGESTYTGYEMWVRRLETHVYGIVGATGGFYATRTALQRIEVPEHLSRDFSAPLVARSEGYRAVSVDAARAFVPRQGSLQQEYRRKVRTISRGMRTLAGRRQLLNPFRFGVFAWMLFSHKVCRWLLPWAALAAAVGVCLLAPTQLWARWTLIGIGAGGGLALIGWFWPAARGMPRLVAVPAFFALGNLAAVHAALTALRGGQIPIWEPTRRQQSRITSS